MLLLPYLGAATAVFFWTFTAFAIFYPDLPRDANQRAIHPKED